MLLNNNNFKLLFNCKIKSNNLFISLCACVCVSVCVCVCECVRVCVCACVSERERERDRERIREPNHVWGTSSIVQNLCRDLVLEPEKHITIIIINFIIFLFKVPYAHCTQATRATIVSTSLIIITHHNSTHTPYIISNTINSKIYKSISSSSSTTLPTSL